MHLAPFGAAMAALLLISYPSTARANGRYPASNRLVLSSVDETVVAVRTTYGLLLSHDDGATWSWLCEDVLGIPATSPEDPLLELTGSGNIIAGPVLANGLLVSSDMGCNWQAPAGPLGTQLVKDLVVRPDTPDVVLAVTSTYGSNAGLDGGAGYAESVYASSDDGAHWSALGAPLDPSALVTTIDVAASDPQRIYLSIVRGAGATRTASLLVSADDGDTWVERPVPLDPSRESEVFIGAVDPTRADRVYLRTDGTPSRLLVTDDGGQTFQAPPLALTDQMTGFALSPDGSKVYLGSMKDGLYVGPSDTLDFVRTSTVQIQCLATRGAELWACSAEQSGFVAGVSSDDGATFAAKLHLVTQPLIACAPGSSASACGAMPLQSFCDLLPGCDAGADAAVARAPTPASGHGCSVLGGSHTEGRDVAASVALAGAALRRRHASRKKKIGKNQCG